VTIAPSPPALAAPSVTAAVVGLRTRGMRVSSTRRKLLETLFGASRPQPAEELAGGLDIASVYRNLEALEAVGLVRHIHVGHGPRLYELARRRASGYAACERCGRCAPLTPGQLASIRDAVLAATGFDGDFSHFPIVGTCPECDRSAEG
jgi:Fur family transcriptional regulator, ferric uptake regulator